MGTWWHGTGQQLWRQAQCGRVETAQRQPPSSSGGGGSAERAGPAVLPAACRAGGGGRGMRACRAAVSEVSMKESVGLKRSLRRRGKGSAKQVIRKVSFEAWRTLLPSLLPPKRSPRAGPACLSRTHGLDATQAHICTLHAQATATRHHQPLPTCMPPLAPTCPGRRDTHVPLCPLEAGAAIGRAPAGQGGQKGAAAAQQKRQQRRR